jgi:hypothetical protein
VLIDKFLEDAVEVDVDAISDGTTTIIGGIMEHIEAAGVHSGDSACVLPPYSIGSEMMARDHRGHQGHGRRTEGGGADERPVRHQGQPALL